MWVVTLSLDLHFRPDGRLQQKCGCTGTGEERNESWWGVAGFAGRHQEQSRVKCCSTDALFTHDSWACGGDVHPHSPSCLSNFAFAMTPRHFAAKCLLWSNGPSLPSTFLPNTLLAAERWETVITVHPGKPLQLVTTPCDQHRHPPPCQKQKYLACSAFAIRDTAQQPHSYLINVCMSGIQSLQSPRVISDEKASPDTLKLLNRCVCEISWHTQAGCLITVSVKSPDTHKPAASLLC